MTITFRRPILTDLNRIIEIENMGFSRAEAASSEAMLERIEKIPDSFILAISDENTIVGYVVGPVISERYLYDELFERTIKNPETGGYQSVLSLVVDPFYQNIGVASRLLAKLEEESRKYERIGITLTCLASLIPFYEKNGYKNEGIADSQHAGETWYNLVFEL